MKKNGWAGGCSSKYVVHLKQIRCMMTKQKKPSPSLGSDQKISSKLSEPVAFYAPVPTAARAMHTQQPRREATSSEKINSIRLGHTYDAIESLSARLDSPVKELLPIFELAQTTYNKKKREQDRMNRRDTEMLLFINDLIDFGLDVFNGEEAKFQRWLRKPNISLGSASPFGLLDTITGMREVRECLERLEFGQFA